MAYKPFKMNGHALPGIKQSKKSPLEQRRVLTNWVDTQVGNEPVERTSETHAVKTLRGAKLVENIDGQRQVTKYDKQGRIRKSKGAGQRDKFKKDERVVTQNPWIQKMTNTGKFDPEKIIADIESEQRVRSPFPQKKKTLEDYLNEGFSQEEAWQMFQSQAVTGEVSDKELADLQKQEDKPQSVFNDPTSNIGDKSGYKRPSQPLPHEYEDDFPGDEAMKGPRKKQKN